MSTITTQPKPAPVRSGLYFTPLALSASTHLVPAHPLTTPTRTEPVRLGLPTLEVDASGLLDRAARHSMGLVALGLPAQKTPAQHWQAA